MPSLAIGQMRPELMPKGPIRFLELRPGELGGAVAARAPEQYCIDDTFFLLLRRHDRSQASIRFVVQMPAGPSSCTWDFNELRPGPYDALILLRATGEIAATAQGEVFEGVSTPMTLDQPRTRVHGTVTVAGLPSDGAMRLKMVDEVTRWEWKAWIDSQGNYRVDLNSEPTDRVCAILERTERMNEIRECATFQTGTQRFDIDLPPGVLRINVLPNRSLGPERKGSIRVSEAPGHSWSRTFTLADGIQGDYFGRGLKTYRISVTAVEGQPLTEIVTANLTPENQTATVEFFKATQP